jgi:hypothetical protein
LIHSEHLPNLSKILLIISATKSEVLYNPHSSCLFPIFLVHFLVRIHILKISSLCT